MRWFVTLMIVFVLGTAPDVQAYSEQEEAREAYQRGEILSLSDIMRAVRQQVNGRIIRTHFMASNGSRTIHIYSFHVLSKNGDIVRIDVDASNSNVIQVQGQPAGSDR